MVDPILMTRELVEQAMQGDRDAFATLVGRSLRRLVGTAGLILQDPAGADDAAQEALIRAWRDLPKLRDPDRFDRWLYRLLVRACHDQRRRSRNELPIDLVFADRGPWQPDAASRVADRDELDRGFAHLSDEHRLVVVLRYYAGFSDAEVARVAALPIGTVKSRLSRALDLLRAGMAADARAALVEERQA